MRITVYLPLTAPVCIRGVCARVPACVYAIWRILTAHSHPIYIYDVYIILSVLRGILRLSRRPTTLFPASPKLWLGIHGSPVDIPKYRRSRAQQARERSPISVNNTHTTATTKQRVKALEQGRPRMKAVLPLI